MPTHPNLSGLNNLNINNTHPTTAPCPILPAPLQLLAFEACRDLVQLKLRGLSEGAGIELAAQENLERRAQMRVIATQAFRIQSHMAVPEGGGAAPGAAGAGTGAPSRWCYRVRQGGCRAQRCRCQQCHQNLLMVLPGSSIKSCAAPYFALLIT